MNILTFDVEEWFHLLDFDATRTEEEWGGYEVRIHENVDRILDILDETNTKATFFVIGWIAKTYPEVVRKIAEKYDANFEVIRCTGNYQNQHNVPKFVFESMKRGFEDYEGEKFV